MGSMMQGVPARRAGVSVPLEVTVGLRPAAAAHPPASESSFHQLKQRGQPSTPQLAIARPRHQVSLLADCRQWQPDCSLHFSGDVSRTRNYVDCELDGKPR